MLLSELSFSFGKLAAGAPSRRDAVLLRGAAVGVRKSAKGGVAVADGFKEVAEEIGPDTLKVVSFRKISELSATKQTTKLNQHILCNFYGFGNSAQ